MARNRACQSGTPPRHPTQSTFSVDQRHHLPTRAPSYAPGSRQTLPRMHHHPLELVPDRLVHQSTLNLGYRRHTRRLEPLLMLKRSRVSYPQLLERLASLIEALSCSRRECVLSSQTLTGTTGFSCSGTWSLASCPAYQSEACRCRKTSMYRL